MSSSIEDFVQTCNTCGRAKPSHHSPYGFLQPLAVADRPWSSVTLDFIVKLPLSNGFDSILVVVDRFTKMAHFIPCLTTATAEQTADLFMRNIFRLHGAPSEIISDRGPQFSSTFWKSFFTLLGTKVKLSTAYHPQTDGQSERTNQTLEQFLRCYINYQQNDWVSLLPHAEYSYNNTIHMAIQCTPFFATYGLNPTSDFQTVTESYNPNAESRIQDITEIHDVLKHNLKKAADDAKRFADVHRSKAPLLNPGDLVYLNSKNVKSLRKSPKLGDRRLGPFPN